MRIYHNSGITNHPMKHTYMGIKKRCYSVNAPCYPRYGGRGIKMCGRWLASFKDFCDDMGPKPSKNHSVDRIDNDGPYSPENCRWATRNEQQHNRGDNRRITSPEGVNKMLIEWCKIYNIKFYTVIYRIDSGWDEWEALTTPLQVTPKYITSPSGERKDLREWAHIYGINYRTIKSRIHLYSWPEWKAVITPARKIKTNQPKT